MRCSPLPVSYYVGTLGTHTEIKRVAEEKVTLPCHHQLGLPEKDTLDIEWLLTDNEGNQKVVSVQLARGPRPHSSPHSPTAVFPQSSDFLLEERARIALSSGLSLEDSRDKNYQQGKVHES